MWVKLVMSAIVPEMRTLGIQLLKSPNGALRTLEIVVTVLIQHRTDNELFKLTSDKSELSLL